MSKDQVQGTPCPDISAKGSDEDWMDQLLLAAQGDSSQLLTNPAPRTWSQPYRLAHTAPSWGCSVLQSPLKAHGCPWGRQRQAPAHDPEQPLPSPILIPRGLLGLSITLIQWFFCCFGGHTHLGKLRKGWMVSLKMHTHTYTHPTYIYIYISGGGTYIYTYTELFPQFLHVYTFSKTHP